MKTMYLKIFSKKLGVSCLLILLAALPYTVLAQEKNISGTVLDETGIGMPGVTILEKGTTNGTSTDADGKFRIAVSGDDAILLFSFVGYKSMEVPVGNRVAFDDIKMEPDITSLQEVVVVGYGEQTKATLTGAIEQVKADVFKDRAITNPVLALQGQTPGLVVARNSSRPGREGLALQIRGVTSVNGGAPLIVIDGVPTVNYEAFYSLNPDDIETISVLKDGSAAIYGSRAANGVILVTTKRGKGKMQVEFNSNVRINTIGIRPPTPTMQQYATVWLEAAEQDGVNANYWGWQSRENLEKMQSGYQGIYTTQYWGDIFIGNYPRFDEMYGTTVSNQQNISLSGSSDKSTYRLSAGYAENVGNLVTAYDGKKQYNARFNYDYQVTDWLKIESGVSYFNTHVSSPSGGLDVNSIAADPPFFPSQNPYGQWLANFNIAGNKNSVAQTVDGGRENTYRDQVKIYFAGSADITKELNFRATASFDKEFYNYQMYMINVPQYDWYGNLAPESVNPTSSIRQERGTSTFNMYNALLNYRKSFGDHHVKGMLGVSAEKKTDNRLYGYRQGFEDFGVYDLGLGAVDQKVEADGGASQWGIYSFIGRVNYNYQDKYLLEVSGRRDGSSKFDEGFKWKNYFGGSAGWVLSQEKFMQNISAINALKLRVSYGEMGNQVGIGDFDYLSLMNVGTALFGTTAAQQPAARVSSITTNVRSWERVGITNAGIDFAVMDNKLFGSFDYYVKTNKGMLISVNYPSLLGGGAPKTNSGELKTKGWEAVLGWRSSVGELKYTVSANMGDSRNELVYMEGVSAYNAGKNATVQGYPVNSWFMYQTNGFFGGEEDVTDYYAAVTSGTNLPNGSVITDRLRPGDVSKLDLDDDGMISGSGNIDDKSGDVRYMGDAAPHYVYGMNFGVQFKGFDLAAMFQGVLDQKIQRSGYISYPFYALYTNQPTSFIGKTWTESNTDAAYPRMTASVNRARWNYQNNDFMLQNNRYLRLKTLVVGYTWPTVKITNDFSLNKVRVYFSGYDLFEFTSVKDGFDPEQGENSNNNSYPFYRTYSFGLNVSF